MPGPPVGPGWWKSSRDWQGGPKSGRFLTSPGRRLVLREGLGTAVSWGLTRVALKQNLLWPRAPYYHVPRATQSKHEKHNEAEHLNSIFCWLRIFSTTPTNSISFMMKFLDVRLPILNAIVTIWSFLLWSDFHVNSQLLQCDRCSKHKILSLAPIKKER